MAGQNNAKMFLKSLEAGDVISFHRNNITHWGIYVGNNNVVHLTGNGEDLVQDLSGHNEDLFTVADKKYAKAYVKEDDFFAVAEMFDTYGRNVFDNEERMNPYDPEETVQLAKVMTGRIYYDARWNSCEKMAIFCRYVSPGDTPESKYKDDDDCDKLNNIAKEYIKQHNIETLNMLKQGDLLRIRRLEYDHWAVYIGNNKVIHLSKRENKPSTGMMRCFNICSCVHFPKAIVRKEPFSKVVHNSKAYIENRDDRLTPYPADKIIETAKSKLRDPAYYLLWIDSEQFAMTCRYGIYISNKEVSN